MIEWSADIEKFIADALSPAKVRSVKINAVERQASVEVMPDQLSLAIGRGGQNVRLAAKLTGYRIDIASTEGGEGFVATPAGAVKATDTQTPEEEVTEFIASEEGGMTEVSPEEEAAEDKEVVAENTNTESE